MQEQRSQQAIIYAAKSTEDKRGSIPAQLGDCRAFAEKEKLAVAAEYAEEAASAWSGDRGPELAAALDHAERIGAALIVQHSDRLARGDVRRARHLIEVYLWSLKAGVALRSVQDDSTFENLVMAVVMGERNTEDSRRKSEAVRAGLARRRKQGKFVGSRCFGLTWQRNEKDEREVVHEPTEAPIVRRIAAELLAGVAQLEIARRLNAESVPTARRGRWHQGTIRSILANPAIAGLIRDGDELIEAQHEAIIPRETWDQIQALRDARARTHRRGAPAPASTYSGGDFCDAESAAERWPPAPHGIEVARSTKATCAWAGGRTRPRVPCPRHSVPMWTRRSIATSSRLASMLRRRGIN